MTTYPTEITLPFADGQYRFFLPIAMVDELDQKHGSIMRLEPALRAGIALGKDGNAIFAGGGEAPARAIRDVIRCALVGGNKATVDQKEIEVGPNEAKRLVSAYVHPARPLGESAALAWRILAAAIYGNEPLAPSAANGEERDHV